MGDSRWNYVSILYSSWDITGVFVTPALATHVREIGLATRRLNDLRHWHHSRGFPLASRDHSAPFRAHLHSVFKLCLALAMQGRLASTILTPFRSVPNSLIYRESFVGNTDNHPGTALMGCCMPPWWKRVESDHIHRFDIWSNSSVTREQYSTRLRTVSPFRRSEHLTLKWKRHQVKYRSAERRDVFNINNDNCLTW